MAKSVEGISEGASLRGFELADDLHAWVGRSVPFSR